MVYGVVFEVGLFCDHVSGRIEHFSCGAQAHVLHGVEHPLVDFVGKFVEIDVVDGLFALHFAEYVDGVAGEHRGELDVLAAFTDGQAHLVGIEEDVGFFELFVDLDVVDVCRIEGTLDEEHRVGRVGDHVDVLVSQLAHDAIDATSAHAHARSDGINVGVEAFDGDFGAFARDAGHGAELNDAVGDFGDFAFEESTKEEGAGARKIDFRVAVCVVDTIDHGADLVALVVEVAGNLLRLGQQEVIFFLVHQQRFVFPRLVDFGRDEIALAILILIIYGVVFELKYLAGQRLSEGEDGAAAEILKFDVFAAVFSHFEVGFDAAGFAQRDLFVGIFHLIVSHDFAAAGDFEVTFVGIHHDGEIFVRAEDFGDDAAEAFFEHAEQSGVIDIFGLVEVSEGLQQTGGFGLFFGHGGVAVIDAREV